MAYYIPQSLPKGEPHKMVSDNHPLECGGIYQSAHIYLPAINICSSTFNWCRVDMLPFEEAYQYSSPRPNVPQKFEVQDALEKSKQHKLAFI